MRQCGYFGPLLAWSLPVRLHITVEYRQPPRAEHRPHTSCPPSPLVLHPSEPRKAGVTFFFGRGGAQRGHSTYPRSHSQGVQRYSLNPHRGTRLDPHPTWLPVTTMANTHRVSAVSSTVLRASPVSSQFFVLYTTLQGGCYSTPFH